MFFFWIFSIDRPKMFVGKCFLVFIFFGFCIFCFLIYVCPFFRWSESFCFFSALDLFMTTTFVCFQIRKFSFFVSILKLCVKCGDLIMFHGNWVQNTSEVQVAGLLLFIQIITWKVGNYIRYKLIVWRCVIHNHVVTELSYLQEISWFAIWKYFMISAWRIFFKI